MNSPTACTGSKPRAYILELPAEIFDQIICSCALYGFPEAIAALSQSCRYFHNLIYGQDSDTNATGGPLWREIFLTTFDDPRNVLKITKRPITKDWNESVSFDWKTEFQHRIQAKTIFQPKPISKQALEVCSMLLLIVCFTQLT